MQKYEESLETLKKCMDLESSIRGGMSNIRFVNMLESYGQIFYDQCKYGQSY